jgi:hypothetical protein
MLAKLQSASATGSRIDPADVELANRDMEHLGCRTRYRPDGTPFLLQTNAPGPADA